MFADYNPMFPPRPFWFVSTELLTKVWHAEISVVTKLLAKDPDLPKLFDAPEATVPQRTACFALLAHRKLIEIIDETLIGRYENSPSLDDVESNTIKRTHNLVAVDAPLWALEMQQVVERLPAHIYSSLPEPLRKGGFGSNPENAEQMREIQSAKSTFSNVEQLQALTERVLDQQLRRLGGRWSSVQVQRSQKPKGRRTRDKERMRRDKMIAEIDDVGETIGEFLKLMDERKVKPQPTWSGWPGLWAQAYRNPRLRKLIHKDKSRALARVRRERNR
ncbi:MAG: hypothetical protein LAN71_02785 [Acidobacteriia bacterium]|nr:hypothetical protein [Terriglobia bacterium]